ncbi:MAG: hypothetical protein ACJ746_19885 [Bryobacteraceae bacterium]
MPQFLGKVVAVLAQIRTPLTIAGLSFLILYALYDRILKLRIFEPVGKKGTLLVIHAILHRLFWLAIIALALGVISYITALVAERHPPALQSSTRLIATRLDPTLSKEVMASVFRTASGDRSTLAVKADAQQARYPESVTAVDFQVQNTGTGTALLWKVGLDVVKASIDTTPVLRYTYDVNGSALDLHAVNTGWGRATCELTLKNPQLESLYSPAALTFRGDIETGDRIMLRLAHAGANPSRVNDVRKLIVQREDAMRSIQIALTRNDSAQLQRFGKPLLSDSEARQLQWIIERLKRHEKVDKFEREYFTKSYMPQHAIPADYITVVGSCVDEKQKRSPVSEEARPRAWPFGDDGGRLWIGASTFEIEYFGAPMQSALFSEPTFVAVIDPEATPREKTYPISRAIPPGGVERFFITIGATKSASVTVRFTVYVDATVQLKSDLFTLAFWCPTDCRFTHVVPDGTEFQNDHGTWILPLPDSARGWLGALKTLHHENGSIPKHQQKE